MSPILRLAILDDYQDSAKSLFRNRFPQLEIESFPETLRATNNEERAELIRRLKDFNIISTTRERTAIPSIVLALLPRLKLILTTGAVNAAINKKASLEEGIDACRKLQLPS